MIDLLHCKHNCLVTTRSVVKMIWYTGFKDDVKNWPFLTRCTALKQIRKLKELSPGYPGLPRKGCLKWYCMKSMRSQNWLSLKPSKQSYSFNLAVFIYKTSTIPSWTRYRTYVSSQKWYSLDERRETQHVSWFSRWLIVTACRVTASECNSRLPWVVDLCNISTFQL